MWFADIATALKNEFDPQGYKIKNQVMNLRACSRKILGMFIPEFKLIEDAWGKEFRFENRKSIDILGV